MKVKLEHTENHVPDPDGSGNTQMRTHTKVTDMETGQVIGGLQKATFTFSATDVFPKATLEMFNFEVDAENIDAEVRITSYGKDMKDIDEMSMKEIKEALRWEAQQRYLLQRKVRSLEAGEKPLEPKTKPPRVLNFESSDEAFEKSIKMVEDFKNKG